MKKKNYFLTFLSCIVAGSTMAQIKIDPTASMVGNHPVTTNGHAILKEPKADNQPVTYSPASQRAVDRRSLSYSYIKIGATRYDLQSNASIGRRIVLHDDGTVTAVFTTSTDNSFANRGTGHNHFNGSTWSRNGNIVTPRLENSRTGWPSIGILDGNKEFVIGHIAETGGFVMSVNSSIGDNNFSNQKVILPEGNDRPIWGRAATDNNKHLHIICNYTDSTDPGQTAAPTINGVRAPMMYGRSADGGQTWDVFGRVTNAGSSFFNGSYSGIPALNTGVTKDVKVSFQVENGSVVIFNVDNKATDFSMGDVITLQGRLTNVESELSQGSTIVNLISPIGAIVPGSTVSSSVPGALPQGTVVVNVISPTSIELSNPSNESGSALLDIIPPYGPGRFFSFNMNSNLGILPGFDKNRWNSGSADRYAIDVRDSIVAIVHGGLTTDITVWKSINHGLTFTPIIVDSFPVGAFDPEKHLLLDTPVCSDGTHDILIDHNGRVHIWSGLSRVYNDDTFTSTYNFYPTTAAIGYWNEDMASMSVIVQGNQFDRDNNGQLDLERGVWSTLVGDGRDIPDGIFHVARLTNTSIIRQPSAGIDNSGQMFVTFSVPVEGEVDFNNVNYRDIYIIYSTDGGMTWSAPQNVTQQKRRESDFACIAKKVNDFVHIVLQEDDIPGNNLTHNSPLASNHPIPEDGNDILYAAIPVSDILSGAVGNYFGLNVKDINRPSTVFVVSQNAPNPFSNSTQITIYLSDYTKDLEVKVSDLMGKTLMTERMSNLYAGNHVIQIDASNFTPGIYYYSITSGNNTVTKKMMVK